MNKTYIWLIVVLIIIVGSATYINTNYFFNPITFKSDEITDEPWHRYKNPLFFSVNNLQQNRERENVLIESQKEVEFVFNELKKSVPVKDGDHKSRKQLVNISIQRKSDDLMLFYAHIYDDHIEFNNQSWQMTETLRRFITEKLY